MKTKTPRKKQQQEAAVQNQEWFCCSIWSMASSDEGCLSTFRTACSQ